MAVTVRLGPRAERTLSALAKRKRMSRSDVVREAIVRYGASEGADGAADSPYAAWADVIGIVSLGARDPGRTTGEQFAAMVGEQRRARRSR
jgi:Arc/MetJ-type ribon-helix-helix transcriptional regulator